MGRYMIPCCCICGRCAESYDDSKWKYQDFCPKHDFLITLKLREDMNSYQPKVSNTQKYEDSQGSHVVTTGKLILIPIDNIPVDADHIIPRVDDQIYKSIIISETEKIEEGDKIYNPEDLGDRGYIVDGKADLIESANYHKTWFHKILALPEHFSDKHLQAIVDGKMKDGDKVLVKLDFAKCERNKKGHCIEKPNCMQWLHSQTSGVKKPENTDCDKRPTIYLDQQNYITLFPAKQSLVEEAEEVLNEIIDSWESLEGGRNYNKRDIERWLIRDMKPVMDKARIFVGREIPS